MIRTRDDRWRLAANGRAARRDPIAGTRTAASQPAHPLTFVTEQIELASIGSRREIGLVERHTGAMQEDFATDTANPGAKRPICFDGVGPGYRIVIAHVPPTGVVMKRAADACALWRDGIVMASQPRQTVSAGHPLFDQRETFDLPRLEARFGANDFIGRDADPLLDDGV